jgi:hypothetical protein
MKNYLVKSLFQVQDTNWHFKDRSDEQGLHKKYIEMHQISVGSYSQHLKGNWELKFVQGSVQNINDAFKQTFRAIYDLWKQGNTNILYTDPDTVAIKDIDPWQISDQFMMFNFTDPKSLNTNNHYGRTFPHFFNAGVRLFPAGMNQRIWDLGLSMLDNWEEGTYNTEQTILNAMLWDQGLTLDQALRPEWAYQAQWLPNQAPLWMQDLWNGIDINKSLIIHTHSSRNIDEKLALMKQLTGQK